MASALTCPKCQGQMRNYERSGVHIDQCSECRGIFLDRGELERLMDAEQSHYDAPRAPPSRPHPQQSYDQRYSDRGYKKHYKRKSFLSDIFDFD